MLTCLLKVEHSKRRNLGGLLLNFAICTRTKVLMQNRFHEIPGEFYSNLRQCFSCSLICEWFASADYVRPSFPSEWKWHLDAQRHNTINQANDEYSSWIRISRFNAEIYSISANMKVQYNIIHICSLREKCVFRVNVEAQMRNAWIHKFENSYTTRKSFRIEREFNIRIWFTLI